MGEARRKQRHQTNWDKKGLEEVGLCTNGQLKDTSLRACKAPRSLLHEPGRGAVSQCSALTDETARPCPLEAAAGVAGRETGPPCQA